MAKAFRLDGWLADAHQGSRSECRNMVRRGRVTVNGNKERNISFSVNDDMLICVDGIAITAPRRSPLTVIMHKPLGYACSNDEREAPLIGELVPKQWINEGLNSIGRLDRETSGLLLMTTDGPLLHRLIHPKRKVGKRYQLTYSGTLCTNAMQLVTTGLVLEGDPKPCLPASLEIHENGRATMILHEGRYHQVRRMIQNLGGEVITLHRDRLGFLDLPADLEPGMVREIQTDELLAAQQSNDAALSERGSC